MTPEGKVKKAVKDELKVYGEDVYYEMPVPGGFGKSGLDFTICFYGRFVAIETKAPGGKTTPRQDVTIEKMRRAGGYVCVVGSVTEARTEFREFLKKLVP